MAHGPEAGLRILDAIAGADVLRSYAPLPAARGDLLFRTGRLAEARTAFLAAAALTRNEREKAFLLARVARVARVARCDPTGPEPSEPLSSSGNPSNCGSPSVIGNHGAFDPTKMCMPGRLVGSSTSVPIATWTNCPFRTTE